MPNTSHGGGISRKISNGADRKRLKSIISDLKLPSTMGLIVRTAGLSRTKVEIKRDFDYLARLWDEVRERTLSSSAPALIYRDSDLIKRAIRDLYHREIDEVVVEGDDGYKAARGFMKLLMPSHVRRVKQYVDPVPVFQRYGVEDQLTAMYQPVVQLKSGGYLVINPTEALVSIDINSGRSTREHNIEQTAFATNIEAAHEIARQLRLRDMAGLVVIDFIDMEQSSHVRKVEKAMKEALKNDRARIQVGRISGFGLMEMSRQRLRTGVLEASTKACPHCEGTGLMRTASSAGLSALRIIEDEAARGRGDRITLRAGGEAAIYVLNRKRAELAEIEERYGVTVEIVIDEGFRGRADDGRKLGPAAAAEGTADAVAPIVEEEDEYLPEVEEEEVEEAEARAKPRRGKTAARTKAIAASAAAAVAVAVAAAGAMANPNAAKAPSSPKPPARRPKPSSWARRKRRSGRAEAEGAKPRRGRRGGRGRRARGEVAGRTVAEAEIAPEKPPMADLPVSEEPAPDNAEPVAEEKPKARRRPRARKAARGSGRGQKPSPAADRRSEAAAEVPCRRSRPKARSAARAPRRKPTMRRSNPSPPARPRSTPEASNEDVPGEPRRGWWQRTFG